MNESFYFYFFYGYGVTTFVTFASKENLKNLLPNAIDFKEFVLAYGNSFAYLL